MARPSTARRFTLREQRAVGIAAGEDVVPGRPDLRSGLGEGRVSGEVDTVAVKLLDAGRDLDSLRVNPWSVTDPVARVDGRRIA
jgi:hypothetical protein